jgi:methyl-accepting chemotaxis protein
MLIHEAKIRYERISPMLILLDGSGRILYSSDVLNRFLGQILEGRIFFDIFQVMDLGLQVSETLEISNNLLDIPLLFTTTDGKLAFRGSFIDELDGEHRRYFLLCAPWLSWIVDNSLEDILHVDQFPLQDTQFDISAFIDTQKVMRGEQEELLSELLAAKASEDIMRLAKSKIENELFLSKQEHEAVFDNNIVRVINALSRGDLNQKIVLGNPEETTRHRAISENLNTMVDQLRRFSEEVTRVAREVGTEGKLGGQAEVPGVDGTWKEI